MHSFRCYLSLSSGCQASSTRYPPDNTKHSRNLLQHSHFTHSQVQNPDSDKSPPFITFVATLHYLGKPSTLITDIQVSHFYTGSSRTKTNDQQPTEVPRPSGLIIENIPTRLKVFSLAAWRTQVPENDDVSYFFPLCIS